jgi:GAF domain-containing protein
LRAAVAFYGPRRASRAEEPLNVHARYLAAADDINAALGDDHKLDAVLAAIAGAVARATGIDWIGVVLASEHGELWMAVAHGMDDEYAQAQRRYLTRPDVGTRRAIDERHPVLIADIAGDTRYGPAYDHVRRLGVDRGLRSIAIVPMIAGGRALGSLNLYARAPRTWDTEELGLLEGLARHAATAIHAASNAATWGQQIDALTLFSRTLRQESHEYANRLHTLSGMLEAGSEDDARRFLADLVRRHHARVATVLDDVRHATLAGLLMMKHAAARERGIALELADGSRLDALPASLSDVAAVTIVGNLVDNALDAAAALPDPRRRRVVVQVEESLAELLVVVRDWGTGIQDGAAQDLLAVGWTRKEGHAGLGLALVAEAVHDAGGTLAIEPLDEGLAFRVSVPYTDEPPLRTAATPDRRPA